jgi:ribosomal protein S18 acetylase RimI-like enzyme
MKPFTFESWNGDRHHSLLFCGIDEVSIANAWTFEQAFLDGVSFRVAKAGGKSVGYVAYWRQPEPFDRHIELIRIAVDRRRRRRGIGRLLFDSIFSFSNDIILADVSNANLPGQMFLQHCGGRAIGGRNRSIRFVVHR